MKTVAVGLDYIKTTILQALNNMLQQEMPHYQFDAVMAAYQYVLDIDESNQELQFEIVHYDDLKKEFEIWQKRNAILNLVNHQSASENAKLWDKINESTSQG